MNMSITQKVTQKKGQRNYSFLWEQLKLRKKLTIECDARVANKLKKAIQKEKWLDDGFKIINEVEKIHLKDVIIEEVPNTRDEKHPLGLVQITFELGQKYGLVEIRA